ncbi:HAD hydrolase-like protein [Nocardioidaceae bacterium SCSIO 66511]|nr:HAD hydrolase-like protein [Nocardioidaceae bacterium SCSIO 66511]
MTGNEQLRQVVEQTSALLLDFDGPITPLLPGTAGRDLARIAVDVLHRASITVPDHIEATTDHLAVLRFAADTQAARVLGQLEEACRAAEVMAAAAAEPTPGSDDVLYAAQFARRPIVIVTNNADEAVDTYLHRRGLTNLIVGIVGREPGHPELMKPHARPVQLALEALRSEPESCAFVGDSVTDIEVSHATGVHSIGYAKTRERGQELANAQADVIIHDMSDLATAIR